MELPLRFDFGTEAGSDQTAATRTARLEAKAFLQNIESASLMGNLDPEDLAQIATDAMVLAAEKFSGQTTKEKQEASQKILYALKRLREIENEINELTRETKRLSEDIKMLEKEFDRLNSELLEINEMLPADKGGEDQYDRQKALKALGLKSDSDITDADIQALLWDRKREITGRLEEIEAERAAKQARLEKAQSEMAVLEDEFETMSQRLSRAENSDQIPSVEVSEKLNRSATSEIDQSNEDVRSNAIESMTPGGAGGF